MIRFLPTLLVVLIGIALAVYPHIVLRGMTERQRAKVPAYATYLAYAASAAVAVVAVLIVIHVTTTVGQQL